jgi:hypothetical protein
MTSIEDAKN